MCQVCLKVEGLTNTEVIMLSQEHSERCQDLHLVQQVLQIHPGTTVSLFWDAEWKKVVFTQIDTT